MSIRTTNDAPGFRLHAALPCLIVLGFIFGIASSHAAEDVPGTPPDGQTSRRQVVSASPAPLPGSAPGATGMRVGVLDLELLARESRYVRSQTAGVEAQMRELASGVEMKVQELRRSQDSLERQRGLLNAEQVAAREQDVRQRRDELEELQLQARRLARDSESRVIEPILRDVLEVAQEYAADEGFDVILRADSVLFVSTRADITRAVMEVIDARVVADAPTAATPASTTPAPARP